MSGFWLFGNGDFPCLGFGLFSDWLRDVLIVLMVGGALVFWLLVLVGCYDIGFVLLYGVCSGL